MGYELKVKDAEGRVAKITPLIGSIVTSGMYSAPSSLNPDTTYGFDLSLSASVPTNNIAVFTSIQSMGFNGYCVAIGYNSPPNQFYTIQTWADPSVTYYQLEPVTAHMSVWTAGSLAPNDPNNWDKQIAARPIVKWLYDSNLLKLTSLRIFPAVMYYVYDYSAGTFTAVYALHGVPTTNNGVHAFFLSVIIKEWDY